MSWAQYYATQVQGSALTVAYEASQANKVVYDVVNPNVWGQWAQITDAAGSQAGQNQSTGSESEPAGPQGLDPNKFDRNKTPGVIRDIARVLKKYPVESGDCSKAAGKVYEKLAGAGYNTEIVRWSYTIDADPMGMQLSNGKTIATTRGVTYAYHEFVRVGEWVFDAITGPEGMLWQDYIKQWDPYTLRWVTETVTKTSQ